MRSTQARPSRARRVLQVLLVCSVTLATVLTANPQPARADDEAIEAWGDWLQVLLPATAGFSTFFVGDGQGNRFDKEGFKQFAWSFGFSFGTVRLGKIVVAKSRPNSNNTASFPSGHTNAAFSGAAFIGTRYGPLYGSFAYAGAAFVGYSRVHSNWHYADDVVAGASIGLLYNWYFVTPHPNRVQMLPAMVDGSPGVEVEVALGDRPNEPQASWRGKPYGPRNNWGFNFNFGPAFLQSNVVASQGGTSFDLNDFNKDADPITNAAAIADYTWKRHLFAASYWPLESADKGMFQDPVEFGGATFPANQEIYSSWRLHDFRATWQYGLLRSERWTLNAGAGVLMQDLRIALKTADDTVESAVDDFMALPYLSAAAEYHITDQVSVDAFGDLMSWPEDRMLDLAARLNYRFNRAWTWGAGYYYYGREISTDKLYNSVAYNIAFLSVRHDL